MKEGQGKHDSDDWKEITKRHHDRGLASLFEGGEAGERPQPVKRAADNRKPEDARRYMPVDWDDADNGNRNNGHGNYEREERQLGRDGIGGKLLSNPGDSPENQCNQRVQ